ncbi:MAG TPA: hypothetical protein VI911_11860 [Patescibacteria group bacterium]|nr:hypothetical protein [Patescibacteria group bacterium]
MSNLLTETQKKFLELSQRYEQLKEEMKKINPELNQLMEQIGIGTYFQDPATKLVYKISQPTGTFVEYKKIDYDRTKKESESKGSLSKTEAEKQGFDL